MIAFGLRLRHRLLQPLDVSVMKALKAHAAAAFEPHLRSISRLNFVRIVTPALQRAFTCQPICAGWAASGLVPLDAGRVIARLADKKETGEAQVIMKIVMSVYSICSTHRPSRVKAIVSLPAPSLGT